MDLLEVLFAFAPLEVRARRVMFPERAVASIAHVLVLRRAPDAAVARPFVLAAPSRIELMMSAELFGPRCLCWLTLDVLNKKQNPFGPDLGFLSKSCPG